jgi:hypothetical protein
LSENIERKTAPKVEQQDTKGLGCKCGQLMWPDDILGDKMEHFLNILIP